MISSALTVWPDSVTAVLRSRSPMTVRRADAPESSYPLLIAWWLSNPSLSFSLLSTHPNCISQCGCWRAKSISEYRFESHNYCTVEWNRYCSIQTRSSSFCLFYFSQVVVFLLLLFMLQLIVIINVFAKHCTCSCEWCVWYFIVFV